jgi:RNA polymerase sigma factor (sigma-70 family)
LCAQSAASSIGIRLQCFCDSQLRIGLESRQISVEEPQVQSEPNGLLHALEEHGAELFALLARLTMRIEVAEDLLQELFLKLRVAKGFATANNRKAYLFRTAIHLAFDWRRGQRPTEPLRSEPAGSPWSPLDQLIRAEELDLVLGALGNLSQLGRDAVVLRYLQHWDYAAIASQLGKTEHQVRGLCSKAIEQLRSSLLAPEPRRTDT